MATDSAPWLLIVLLGGIVVIGVIVAAIIGVVSIASRKPVHNRHARELDELREEVARLREEVRELKRGRPAGRSTDITDLGQEYYARKKRTKNDQNVGLQGMR
jgi:cell division protein FtsB